jgi:hypothetical protein
MPSFTVEFDDNETMPERIVLMAADLGITPEMLIRRALAEHLDGFGLRDVPPGIKVKTLQEFLVESGVLKGTNPVRKEDEPCGLLPSPNQGTS